MKLWVATAFNPNLLIGPARTLLACRHLTSDILEGIVGYVKENKTGKMPTVKRKMDRKG